jgi:hypothetical protein
VTHRVPVHPIPFGQPRIDVLFTWASRRIASNNSTLDRTYPAGPPEHRGRPATPSSRRGVPDAPLLGLLQHYGTGVKQRGLSQAPSPLPARHRVVCHFPRREGITRVTMARDENYDALEHATARKRPFERTETCRPSCQNALTVSRGYVSETPRDDQWLGQP